MKPYDEASRPASGWVDQEEQVEYLEDKLFGNFPSKLWSAEVAVRGCLLVDWPLQVQLPGEEEIKPSQINTSLTLNSIYDVVTVVHFCLSFLLTGFTSVHTPALKPLCAQMEKFQLCRPLAVKSNNTQREKKAAEIPTVCSVYLTMTPGRRSKFLLTMWSSSVSVFSEEP